MRTLWMPCVLLATVSCAPEPSPPTVSIAPSPAPTTLPTPTQSALPQRTRHDIVRIDKIVKFDDSEWIIVEARDGGQELKSNSEYLDEVRKTSGRFVLVHYKLTNLGKKEEMLLDRPKITDSKTREFGPIDMESFYVPAHSKTVGLDTLEPSIQKDYWTIIEVASDARHLKFIVHGFALLGEKRSVELGL